MARNNKYRSAPSSRYPRTARVNEVLREVIASELERIQSDDTRLDLVTVTAIEADSDLRHATVYFSALATTASSDEVVEALQEHRVALQAAVGGSVRFKRTPQLRFVADPAIVAGARIEEVLRHLPPVHLQPEPEPETSLEAEPSLGEAAGEA